MAGRTGHEGTIGQQRQTLIIGEPKYLTPLTVREVIELYRAGVMTLNEARHMVGLNPIKRLEPQSLQEQIGVLSAAFGCGPDDEL